MRVLIIEDDSNKAKNIARRLDELNSGVNVTTCRSASSGLSVALSEPFDVLLLDMSLPRFDVGPGEDGYEFDFFAGREVLFELSRKDIRIPTIVITQFETFGEGDERLTIGELDGQLMHEFSDLYRGIVYYSASQLDWRRQLETKLLEIK